MKEVNITSFAYLQQYVFLSPASQSKVEISSDNFGNYRTIYMAAP